jgi:hypothetical protein
VGDWNLGSRLKLLSSLGHNSSCRLDVLIYFFGYASLHVLVGLAQLVLNKQNKNTEASS